MLKVEKKRLMHMLTNGMCKFMLPFWAQMFESRLTLNKGARLKVFDRILLVVQGRIKEISLLTNGI